MSRFSAQPEHGLSGRIAALRRELRGRDPAVLARHTGANLDGDDLEMLLWQQLVRIPGSDFVPHYAEGGRALDLLSQGLVAYYLHGADGALPAGEWIAFSELPDGLFYADAFQGYTGGRLARHFADDLGRFREAAVALGGQPVPFAGAAFRFQVLPYVPVLVAVWPGDEDFVASYRLLFDAHASHHLPTDACAIMGSMVTGRLVNR